MNRYFMRAAALSAAAMMTLTSCSGKKVSGGSKAEPVPGGAVVEEHNVQTANEVFSDAYNAEKMDAPEGMSYMYNIVKHIDGGYAATVVTEKGDIKLYKCKEDFSDYTDITPDFSGDFPAGTYYPTYAFNQKGDLVVLVRVEDHGGMTVPDESDQAALAAFDWDAYEKNKKTEYYVAVYNHNGRRRSISEKIDLSFYETDYKSLMISNAVATSDDSVLFMRQESPMVIKVERYGNDSLLIEPGEQEQRDVSGYNNTDIFFDRDGKMIVAYEGIVREGNDSHSELIIRELDPEQGHLEEPICRIQDAGEILKGKCAAGRGEYRLFVPTQKGLLGIKDDGTYDEKVNWQDSNLQGGGSYFYYPVGEDEFVGGSFFGGDKSLYKLVHPKKKEGKGTVVLTVGGIGYNSDFFAAFNKSQDDYRIKTIDYWQYAEDDGRNVKPVYDKLKLDIISGNGPDVLLIPDKSIMNMLAAKGAFVDLYEFMQDDPDVNKDTLLPNVLKACESSDGKLYSLLPEFQIRTIAAKKKFDLNENWTVDDMVDFFDNAPATADHLYDGMERDTLFMNMIGGMSELVDYDKATCNFDSDSFVKVLEFCKRFPEKEDKPDKSSDPDGLQQYYKEKASWWMNDRQLIEDVRLEGGTHLMINEMSSLRADAGEDITFVGYPSSDGHGGKIGAWSDYIAILNTCPDKEGAWQFVRSYFTNEWQDPEDPGAEYDMNKIYLLSRFPVRKDSFDIWLETTKYALDFGDDGKIVKTTNPVSYNRLGRAATPLTDEEAEDFKRYILSCDTIYGNVDPDLLDICMEEAREFFAGEATAKQAAERIQNRCSILISEKS